MRVKTEKKLHIYEYIENEIKEGHNIPRPVEMETFTGPIIVIFKRDKNIVHAYRFDPTLYHEELYMFSYNLRSKRGE